MSLQTRPNIVARHAGEDGAPAITLVVLTEGNREHLHNAVAGAQSHLTGRLFHTVMVDDSGDLDHAAYLEATFPTFAHIHHPERRGLSAAARTGWTAALVDSDIEFVFLLEEGVTLTRTVHLDSMAALLRAQPHLGQLVVKREPAGTDEEAAGGVLELAAVQGHLLADCEAKLTWRFAADDPSIERTWHLMWTEDRELPFSHDPSLIRREALECLADDPDVTAQLRAAGYSFAYWGHRAAPPWARRAI